jgi:hypothetical protein
MRTSILASLAFAAVIWTSGARAQAPPLFDGQFLDAAVAEHIALVEGDELLLWGECRARDASTVPGCMLLALEDGAGFEVVAITSQACDRGDCYAGYARAADVTVDDAQAVDLARLVETHGGLGGTPLGLTETLSEGGSPSLELRVRVHGGIATSPLGVLQGEGPAPELRVRVYGGLATSPLGIEGAPHPAEVAAADLLAMAAAVLSW